MAIVVHSVYTPKRGVDAAYASARARFDELGARHPAGRLSHTAWLSGEVLHILEVWESEEDRQTFMLMSRPVISEAGMILDGRPKFGELLNVVVPTGVLH